MFCLKLLNPTVATNYTFGNSKRISWSKRQRIIEGIVSQITGLNVGSLQLMNDMYDPGHALSKIFSIESVYHRSS